MQIAACHESGTSSRPPEDDDLQSAINLEGIKDQSLLGGNALLTHIRGQGKEWTDPIHQRMEPPR